MSSKTHPVSKVKKGTYLPPGTIVGPMKLPLSYNMSDYVVSPDGDASKVKRRGEGSEDKGRYVKGALRYRRNKLLDGAPLE